MLILRHMHKLREVNIATLQSMPKVLYWVMSVGNYWLSQMRLGFWSSLYVGQQLCRVQKLQRVHGHDFGDVDEYDRLCSGDDIVVDWRPVARVYWADDRVVGVFGGACNFCDSAD